MRWPSTSWPSSARPPTVPLAANPPRRHWELDGSTEGAELVDGTPLHPAAAVAVLASATLRRLVMGAESEILDLGRRVRCFPQHLGEVLLVAGRGQRVVRGCDAPVTWLQADHLVPWARGGPTDVANGRTCCDPHNKADGDGHPP